MGQSSSTCFGSFRLKHDTPNGSKLCRKDEAVWDRLCKQGDVIGLEALEVDMKTRRTPVSAGENIYDGEEYLEYLMRKRDAKGRTVSRGVLQLPTLYI